MADATMAARLTRAKKKIVAARIRYAVPSADELPERVDAVMTVIHLLYTTEHTAHSGEDLVGDELTDRTLDLARMLRLEEQDRSAWDRELIAEADRLVVAALRAGPPGRFSLQAAIAAVHAQAPSYAETDWPQILELYDALLRIWPSPVVALNRAVAVSMVDGPEAALAEVEALERDRLDGYRYLPATKADLLNLAGALRDRRVGAQVTRPQAPVAASLGRPPTDPRILGWPAATRASRFGVDRSTATRPRSRCMSAHSPEEIHTLIAAAVNAGDLDAFVQLHEENATVIVPPEGRRISARDAIRAAVEPTFALGPSAQIEVVGKLQGDGLALTHARVRVVATEGGEVMSGRGTIVSRRQPDGTWRIVLDNPMSPE